jgi:hypothetical protein
LPAVNVSPCCAVPDTVGALEFTGAGSAVTVEVFADVAGVDPPAFVAVTTTSTVSPTSEDRNT